MQAVGLAKPSVEQRRETQNGSETQGSAGQGLTMVQAERVLRTLVEEGWLEKSRKGYYSLSPRALMELRGWLDETYNDPDEDDEPAQWKRIKACQGCKDIITVVSRARRMRCRERLTNFLGPTVCTKEMPLPPTRHLRSTILPHPGCSAMPPLQDGVDGQRLRGGAGGDRVHGEVEEEAQIEQCDETALEHGRG